jgi:hypothetical protein
MEGTRAASNHGNGIRPARLPGGVTYVGLAQQDNSLQRKPRRNFEIFFAGSIGSVQSAKISANIGVGL